MQSILSPDVETFSTPPTTPIHVETDIRPSLSRRPSRPSQLRIQQNASATDWRPHVIIENLSPSQPSPPVPAGPVGISLPPGSSFVTTSGPTGASTPLTAKLRPHTNGTSNGVNGLSRASADSILNVNGGQHDHQVVGDLLQSPISLASMASDTSVPTLQQIISPPPQTRTPRMQQPISSPCFVHSRLHNPSLNKWLESTSPSVHESRLGRIQKPVEYNGVVTKDEKKKVEEYGFWHDEENSAGALTKQLAETAVGVREMSKQLGRTRVRSVIQSVLIVTKARDNRLIKLTRELALFLMLKPRKGGRGMIVYVDSQLKTSRRFDAAGIERDHPELFIPFPRRRSSSSSSVASDGTDTTEVSESMPEGQLRYWTAEMCSRSPDLFDFVITLGGDGTVLFTSWLFQRIVPPVLPFALGSLGFLTNFDFNDHQSVMDNIFDSGIRVNLRMRFTCTVYRAVAPEDSKSRRRAVKKGDTGEILMKNLDQGGWEALENGFAGTSAMGKGECKDKEIMCFTTRPVESFEVLNDLVVDRGPSPYVSLLELFGDEHHLTTVQADGLTVATPTGSTAYSLSAGGSLVHPEIPAILITPICPHTLSFRPMLLPDSMDLRICVPYNSRSTAWASFDGRGRVELKQGDHIKVTASKYPFPTVCADSQSTDWFNSISRTLKWNERERQKSFVVVEEGPSARPKRSKKAHAQKAGTDSISPSSSLDGTREEEEIVSDEEEDEVTDEEEEKFDIDDLSASESPQNASGVTTAEKQFQTKLAPWEEANGRGKAQEVAAGSAPPPDVSPPALPPASRRPQQQTQAEAAARSLIGGRPRKKSKSSRSRSRTRSGLETPDRFAGPHPHPPRLSPRHLQFLSPSASSSSSSLNSGVGGTSMDREATVRSWERGARDDIHSSRSHGSGRSRIPRERDRSREGGPAAGAEAEMLRTPTSTTVDVARRRREREPSGSPHRRVAFAVWGQDESDSATSDSDA